MHEITSGAKAEEYQNILNGMNDSVWIIDLQGNIVDVNTRAIEILDYSLEDFKEMKVHEIDKNASEEDVLILIKGLTKDKKQVFESVHLSRSGEEIPVEISSSLIDYRGKLSVLSIARDMSQRKEQQKKIRHMTFHDQLTGLYNRHYLEEEMQRLNTKRQHPISIIIADVNNLKIVNDTYGHQKGDQLLKNIAQIIKDSCREEEIIARIGGDEFIILLPQTSKNIAQEILERIRKNLNETDFIDEIKMSAALGLSVKNKKEEKFDNIIKQAEDRMYKNKIKNKRVQGRNLLLSIMQTLKEKSDEDEAHLQKVREYSVMLAEALSLSQHEINKLKIASFYHDIGKIVIHEKILNKKEKLSSDDWKVIKLHSELGTKLLAYTDKYKESGEIIRYHHEYWDGSGYPEGRAADEIPLLSRILSIADAYDVMTRDRVYKKRMSKVEASEELNRCAGAQFDPDLVELFLELINN